MAISASAMLAARPRIVPLAHAVVGEDFLAAADDRRVAGGAAGRDAFLAAIDGCAARDAVERRPPRRRRAPSRCWPRRAWA
jgi:hypothetical protein